MAIIFLFLTTAPWLKLYLSNLFNVVIAFLISALSCLSGLVLEGNRRVVGRASEQRMAAVMVRTPKLREPFCQAKLPNRATPRALAIRALVLLMPTASP